MSHLLHFNLKNSAASSTIDLGRHAATIYLAFFLVSAIIDVRCARIRHEAAADEAQGKPLRWYVNRSSAIFFLPPHCRRSMWQYSCRNPLYQSRLRQV